MKFRFLFPLVAIAFSPALKAQEAAAPAQPAEAAPAPAPPAELTPELLDKVSYFYGTRIAGEFVQNQLPVNLEAFTAGLKDTLDKKEPKFQEKDIEEFMTQFSQIMMAKQEAAAKEAGGKNTAEGEKFLTENGKREGVKTTASGLQYEVVKEGDGAVPKAEDTVSVHYHGTLINGTVFDSSIGNDPATFPVGGVIPGWTEALQLMKVGSKYKLFIPSALAYGDKAVSPEIGPNTTLIFEVELLKIDDKNAAPAPAPAN
ncbi:FKBP-type peptidyl-prolyl cis-trans isomerase [Phragmitibacter flavus]|uniref:Peptidyl-prolyl cis-trans isomerase n=1 Tax=Phragmitibacter flavus TaxID=2576071 RepID=A0A5R8KH49_9BACT|nr:FKBP-type peptidyl-prolyl cis-trans isomerase [Phragmitibacter flavus]TLD71644.1 FKBP-type peptidyl-prolyl cis-trans isomerase [Phragmitibacter flavus]